MKQIVILLITLLGAAWSAEASQVLTIKDAISMALAKNHLVKARQFMSQAAEMDARKASTRYLPTVAFEETVTLSNSPTQTFMMKLDEGRFAQNDFLVNRLNHPAVEHDYKTSLVLHQPLFVPSFGPLGTLAVKEVERSGHELDAARQDIAFKVFRLYLDVQKFLAQKDAAERAVAEAQENMRLATVRATTGVGLHSDELRARTHLSFMQQQVMTARNNLVLAKMRLALETGAADDADFELAERLERVAVPTLDEKMIAEALEVRSDLKVSRDELEKSRVQLKVAKSSYLPQMDAYAAYRMNSREVPFAADNDAWSAGVSLTWQIFDGFQRCREKDKAIAGVSAANEMLEQGINEAKYQLKESYLRRDEFGKRLEAARHAVLDAEETVRLVTRRFENSLATMVELLDSQVALNQARSNMVEAETSYATAGGQVHYVAGTFLKEMLK